MARGFGTTKGSATTDVIYVARHANYAKTASRTLACRFNRNGNGEDSVREHLLDWYAEYAWSYIVFTTGTGRLYVAAVYMNTVAAGWYVTHGVTDGNWTSVIVTHDTSAANAPVIYIDNVPKTVTADTSDWTAADGADNLTAYEPFGIALGNRYPETAIRGFNGELAECAVWNGILSEAQRDAYANWTTVPTSIGTPIFYASLNGTTTELVQNAAMTVSGTAETTHPGSYVVPAAISVNLGEPIVGASPIFD